MAFKVEIVSAEKAIWSGEANSVDIPGSQGELGIHPGHAPLLTFLKSGTVVVRTEGGADEHFYVSGGVVEVQPSGVIVLSDTTQRAQDLDEAQIREAKDKAEEMLKNQTSKLDYAQLEIQLSQMISQLQTIDRSRSGRK